MNFKIIDNDGFLALVDTSSYQSYLAEGWTFDQLFSHFVEQSNRGHIVIWRTGDEGDQWSVCIEAKKSATESYREFETEIKVTEGQLYLTEYADLTMAASYSEFSIPSKHNASLSIPLESGVHRVTVRQLFDPTRDYSDVKVHFEIVFKKSGEEMIEKADEKVMWFEQ
jgi:hypothetical protein